MFDIGSNDLSDLTADELEALLLRLAGEEALQIASESYLSVLHRLIEMSLFSDPDILALARVPGLYIGSLEARVSNAILRRTGSPDINTAKRVAEMLKSQMLTTETKIGLDAFFPVVVREYAQTSHELRCFYCGYHFTPSDLGVDRRRVVIESGLGLAAGIHAGRLRDPWKPSGGKWTALSLDHRLPESSLGASDPENLAICCNFCNKKKQISRRYAESLASRAAGALMAFVGGEGFGSFAIGGAVFFRVWRDGRCTHEDCGAKPEQTELTAEAINGETKWTTLLPWDLQTRCYRHVRSELDTAEGD